MPRTTSPARRCDAGGGGGAADGARVEEGPTGEIPARWMERPARHDGVPAKPRSGWGRRRCHGIEGDGGVDRHTSDEQEPAGDSTVAPTPLVAGGGTPSGVSAGNGGQAGKGEATATPREATARATGARARRKGRLEMASGTGERGGRWGEVVRPRESAGGG
uniref:Uncharacterized protein n=1 Tax=Oryza sativa subsp. japonica TaxID=39947 RepID=Q33AJ5_ORYSJ|nr:hypothetical protein LOC_Os10g09590 [Oryza sativa Japonica Group]